MKAAIKKAASRKTMRVATVFTGAAACTAALAPAAMAGTHTVTQPLHKDRALTRLEPGATAVKPNISGHACNFRGDSTWLHIAYEGGASVCIGYLGIAQADIPHFSGYCGGNNFGALDGLDGFSTKFGPGDYYKPVRPITTLTHVSISAFGVALSLDPPREFR